MNETLDNFKMDLSEEEINALMKDSYRDHTEKVMTDIIRLCRHMQEKHGTGLDILKGFNLPPTLYENIKTLVENPEMPYEIRIIGRCDGGSAE